MEKKQLISVVKPLIAAALLFGSSGGVAWGQTMHGHDTGGPYNSSSCSAHYTIGSGGWSNPDNNFGPGETGTITPRGANAGWWGGTVAWANPGNGRVTVGNTNNIVVNAANVASVGGSWTSPHCNAGGSTSLIAPTSGPSVPDGTGVRHIGSSVPASVYSAATHITVDAGSSSGSPWQLEGFQFLDNPWYYYFYTLSTPGTCPASCWYWSGTSHLQSSGSWPSVQYTSTASTQGGYVPGIITLLAGGHVRLTGIGTYSVGAGGHTNSHATLNLPAAYYTLMNDKNFDAASIVSNGTINWGTAGGAELGTDAVLGIQGDFVPGASAIITSATGGTILMGAATQGQNKMTVKAPTGGTNTYPYGFSGRGANVYTGVCIPATGTANVGNYGTNNITVETTMTLPTAMSAGKLQIFNTMGNVDFKNKIPATGAGGNILLMAKGTFTMNTGSAHVITMAAGNTSLMGGVVELKVKEDVKVNGSGNYNVFGFDGAGSTPTLAALTWPTLCPQPTYSWCRTEKYERIPHLGPDIRYGLQGAITGQPYAGDCTPLNFMGGGHIKSLDDSEVKVNSSGYARWQAMGNITTGNGKTLKWEVGASATGTATASWLANGNITLGTGNTTNWKSATSTAGDRIFWNAGGNITTNDVTAKWETSDGNMYWRAIGTIQAGSSGHELNTVEWKSTGKGNMLWEATTLNVVNGSNALKFEQTGTGRTNWHAKGNIDAKAGSGGITFTNSSTEANGAGTMTWLAAGNIITSAGNELIKFEQTTATAGRNAWKAGNDILTKSKIEFHNQASKYNMEWHACNDILTNNGGTGADGSDHFLVTFKNEKEGDVIWHANHDIITRSKTDFESTNTASGNITWYAGNDIHTYLGKNHPSTLTNGVNFKQEGAGRTIWQAGRDITTHNAVHFQFTSNAKDWASLGLLAVRNITLGGVTGEYENNHPSLRNEFKVETEVNDTVVLHARNGYILTNSLVNLERSNTGAALTKLWAGCGTFNTNNNIDVEHTFNYTEPTGKGQDAGSLIYLYAENDILSNQDAANGTCDSRQAPITFSVPQSSKTITLWEAERNINTVGRVDFAYGAATSAGPLTWLSRGGYIQTERPVTIAYKSDSTISFLAEDWRHDATHASPGNFTTTGRRGNIHFFDSVRINRNNTAAGMTQLKAENHIWTAMLDYVDEASTGDTMEIISHKGDIYLGYNDNTPTQNPYQYVATMNNGYIMQQRPSASCIHPLANNVSYDKNRFIYTIPSTNTKGHLWIKAGWEEKTDRNSVPDDGSRLAGGNIYFSHIAVNQPTGSDHPTVISIPFSGLWRCGNEGDSILHNRSGRALQYYENAGIISGVNHCNRPYPGANTIATNNHDWGLFYRGGKGDLTVDAGNRGNIIFNKGAYLSFEDPSSTGNVVFRTRFGDIDMRNPFNVDTMTGSLLFLAQIENIADLEHSDFCGCKEERNNVYLQDFEFKAHGASGSVFVGADNNIKLNYGGLQNIGTRHDPFLSKDYEKCNDGSLKKVGEGYIGGALGGCGDDLHCDAISSENKARKFLMKFDKDANGTAITKGGFAAVASDYIDVYKRFEYLGGSGDGMGSVPGTGTLHGETVTGYGLFMKTQANKGNWNVNIFENTPTCPTPCDGTNCGHDYLHMVSRMTFHDDAYIEAHNQEVMLWSPVIETFGDMTLDSEKDKGSKTEITLKADSLIFHSDFIKKGKNIKLSTWSGLHKDLPIMKFGHMRKTPPFVEAKKDDCDAITECVPCYRYIRFSKDPLHMLDTITIKFGDDAYMERLNTVIFDHTVLTCLTDSFDHVKGGAVQNAQIRTDTFKIRNQVDLFADEKHERDAHLELISEEQMGSKDYAGIYTKHLHMEPIGACGTPYSELWTSDDLALDVITTSIFGGFGFIHSDVHVENGGHLNAGFTSLRLKGMCYEQMCGTQRMKDLRLDVGAQLHFSVGTSKGLNGEYSDAIEVDRLTTYGSVDVNIEIRPCEKIEKRCYPIIYYKSVTPNSLNQLKLNPRKVKIDGEEYPLHLNLGTDGVVYVCVGDAQPVDINRTVTLPSVSGVKTDPGAGIWDVKSRGNFKFKATYSGSKPLAVRTNRTVNGVPEMLTGTKNANGEYEYVVPNVQQDITLSIGPDYVSNQLLAGTAVWSHGEMIYIRVDRADIASIYSVAGQLVRKVDLPEGDTSIPMSRGAYVITLKDGSVHKVIVK
ncbi:hypothetical protein [Tannerella serpentiformis]|uniref:hypothetical protein n=1 Tax=Tannerella serpentiformis TaxID=712710 RepID=UPI00131C3A9F|nr:hypothetical protein [Tannerella serpentiformis]